MLPQLVEAGMKTVEEMTDMEIDPGAFHVLLQQEDIIIRYSESQHIPFTLLFLKRLLAVLQTADRDEVQGRAQKDI